MNELEKPEHEAELIKFAATRYSGELLKNRFSDFCGSIRSAWNWLSGIAQIAILVAVVGFTISDLSYAPFAWTANAVALISIPISVLFSFVCHLLTGRWPGQAKAARGQLAQLINEPRWN
jgi:hypothetical protein